MAKEKETTNALVPKGLEGMVTTERPKGGDGAGVPTHIGRDDVTMPRLALAQKTSKELEPGEPRYIEGLKFTDMFHSKDKRTFGTGPVLFSVLRADPPRHIEFKPMDQGGGIVDKDVPDGDPRTKFTTDAQGKSVPPVATKFYDFIVLVLNGFDPNDPMKNVMALSLKSTGIKAAKDLNNLIVFRGKKELFRGAYSLTSGSDKNAKGSYAIYQVANAGWLTEGTPAFRAAQEMHDALKGAEVNIDREHPSVAPEDDPNAPPAGREPGDDDIPI